MYFFSMCEELDLLKRFHQSLHIVEKVFFFFISMPLTKLQVRRLDTAVISIFNSDHFQSYCSRKRAEIMDLKISHLRNPDL